MKSLLKKARENKKGFTLAELLVVVAIVGILVAISIPVFTAQLGKARRATNQANLRAAKAAAVAEYLTSDDTQGADKFYKYNRNLLGGLYRENPVKSRNYEAVKSSKKWENVGNSYIIPALLLYRYSYI